MTTAPDPIGADPAAPAELRRLATDLFDDQTHSNGHYDPRLFDRADVIAEIPTGAGTTLAVIRSRRFRSFGVQVFRLGPSGRAIPVTQLLRIPGQIMPLFGDAVAKALELELADRHREHSQGNETARAVDRGGIPPAQPAGGDHA